MEKDFTGWYHSTIGAVHVAASFIGLALGLSILFMQQGTKLHIRLGYVFVAILVIVNISALFIFDFRGEFGKFGPFHAFIPLSLYSLYLGLGPILNRKNNPDWLYKHLRGMTGAALGLWAAGVVEFFVRSGFIRTAMSSVILAFGVAGIFSVLIRFISKRLRVKFGV